MNPEIPTPPCPDCDPHGFDKNLEAYYGPPTVMAGGIKIYADPRISRNEPWGIDAKSFARSFCAKHRTTSPSPTKGSASKP